MGNGELRCNLSEATTPRPPFWEYGIRSGPAPPPLRTDWQGQLRRCHEELRFHDLLSDHMVRRKERLLYSFFNADQIFDFLVTWEKKPFVELSFMPAPLDSGHTMVFSDCRNVMPPTD